MQRSRFRSVVLGLAFGALVLGVDGAGGGRGAMAAPSDRDELADEAIALMLENSGSGQAEALLGVLYLRGMRIESDPVAAVAWLERAATARHPAGIYTAARMYAEGIGVPANPERARRLLAQIEPGAFGELAPAVEQLRLALDMEPVTTAMVAEPAQPAKPPEPAQPAKAPEPPPTPVKPPEPAQPVKPPEPAQPAKAPEPAQPAKAPEPAQPAKSAEPPPAPAKPPEPPPAVTQAPPAPAPAPVQEAAAPKPAAPAPAAPPPAAPYRIVAARGGDATALRAMSEAIVNRHADLVAGLERSVQPSFEPSGKVAYRLILSGTLTEEQAKRLCAALDVGSADCGATPTERFSTEPAAEPRFPTEPLPSAYAQLATVFAEDAAARERSRIMAALPGELMTRRELAVRPLRLNDGRTAWLVIVTGFANRAEVRGFCEQAAAVKIGCMAKG